MQLPCPKCMKKNKLLKKELTITTTGIISFDGIYSEIWDGFPAGEVEKKEFSSSKKFLGYKAILACGVCNSKFKIRLEV